MSKRQVEPALTVAYWAAALYDAVQAGDPFMIEAAREQLRRLGLEVRPARPRRARQS